MKKHYDLKLNELHWKAIWKSDFNRKLPEIYDKCMDDSIKNNRHV